MTQMKGAYVNSPPTIIHALLRRSESAPDDLAYWIEGNSMTYVQLAAAVDQTALDLLDLGLGEGKPCALMLPTGVHIIRILYAVQRIHAVPVVINPELPMELVTKRLGMIECDLIVANERRLPSLRKAAGPSAERLHFAAAEALAAHPTRQAMSFPLPGPQQTAYLQFTSGTTGEPRASMVSHGSLITFLRATCKRLAITASDVFVGWVPLFHDLGLVRFAFNPLFCGCASYLMEPSIQNFRKWLITISKVGGTITASPDFGFRIAGKMTDPGEVDLKTLRFATNGGEPVRKSTIDSFEQRFGLSGVIRPGYGMAETTLGVTSVALGEPVRTDKNGNVSCGRPYEGVEIRIVDDLDRSLPTGTPGEILVRSETLFSGYLGNTVATKEVMKNGWFYTGDVGKLDKDGHLFILGRKRALIKRAGALIIPREIEEVADQVAGVRFSAAIGHCADGGKGSEEVVVVAEIRFHGKEDPDRRKTIADTIAHKVKSTVGFSPAAVVLVPPRTIPRTRNGKIQYPKLRRFYAEGRLTGRAGKDAEGVRSLPEQAH